MLSITLKKTYVSEIFQTLFRCRDFVFGASLIVPIGVVAYSVVAFR